MGDGGRKKCVVVVVDVKSGKGMTLGGFGCEKIFGGVDARVRVLCACSEKRVARLPPVAEALQDVALDPA